MYDRFRSTAGPAAGLWTFLLLATSVHAATFTVTNVNDTGPGSLRWAITSANAAPGADLIDFAIPGTGPFTITPFSAYAQIADPAGLTIDGLTQPGASAGANPPATAVLMIEIDGQFAGPSHGFWIVSSNNMIRGLAIGGFEQDGVRIQATPAGTMLNWVSVCFVGTDASGTVMRGNGTNGVQLWAGVDIICAPGAPGVAHDNFVEFSLAADCYSEGISISNCPPGDVFFNFVHHNYVGTDVTGMLDFGNRHYGVFIGETAHDNQATDNVVSGNDWGGFSIVGNSMILGPTYQNGLFDNAVGLAADRITPLPNTGNGVDIGKYGAVLEGFAPNNHVVHNQIAHNTGCGVAVWEHNFDPINADGNRIAENSIYSNGGLGIDLWDNGVTPNDPSDPDSGPNQELNCPVILSADRNASTGMTTVAGQLDIDTIPTLAEVQVFKARLDPSGCGEGEVFLGWTTPDAAGNWTGTFAGLAVGDSVTATAIDMGNNTSEFSLCLDVVPAVAVPEIAAGRADLRLEPPRPNPFGSFTEIRFAAPAGSAADLAVYDVTGRRVRSLTGVSGTEQGSVRWDGLDERGRAVTSGVYVLRLEADGRVVTRRAVLLR